MGTALKAGNAVGDFQEMPATIPCAMGTRPQAIKMAPVNPVLVLRNVTERQESVDAGVARLVGTDPTTIRNELSRLLSDRCAYREMARGISPYGDGQAAGRIVEALCAFLRGRMVSRT